MTIIFTKHTEDKFGILKRHKFVVKRHQVLETVTNPEKVDYSRAPLMIAERPFDERHVFRVVYKQTGDTLRIITFYPGRENQYEESNQQKQDDLRTGGGCIFR